MPGSSNELHQAKKLKHQHHTSAHDSFSQYAAPSPAARSYSQTTVQAPVHLAMVPAYEVPPLPPTQPTASSDESLFFERVRHAIDHHETYNEFLKLINLFTQEIIDMRKLVEQSRTYLTDELFAQFKEILGWDTTWENSRGYGMNMGGHHENFERPSREELSVRYGPSYRRLPRDASAMSPYANNMCLTFCRKSMSYAQAVTRCARVS